MKTGFTNSLMAIGFFMSFAGTASAAYFDYAPAPKCDVQINRTLQAGSTGIDVSVLQNFLNRAGYLTATPNGNYGPATTAAVRAFQYSNGISATGSVGPMTLNAINERMCDTDLHANGMVYGYDSYYGSYSSGVTYVDAYDPYVQVISPSVSAPSIYATPQSPVISSNYNTYGSVVVSNNVINPVSSVVHPVTTPVSTIPAATTQIASTNVIYSPSIGYTYGLTPATGSLTISTPVANTVYNEGDTVRLAWTTTNLNATAYVILLENSSTGQSRTVTTVSANNASFTLTKELLDAVCAGACDNNQQGTFRIVITTPIRDIAGTVSTFRAAIAPITIKRPYANFGTVSITTSKTPVSSGEAFKLYVNIPTGASWDANIYGQYSFKIRAVCPAGVSVSIAGVACGNEFSLPFAPTYFQSEIPAIISNTSWYRQDVTFILTVTNLAGQTIGTSQVNVVANQAPFNW